MGTKSYRLMVQRIMALVMCFMLAFSLAGCSQSGSSKEASTDVVLAETEGASEEAKFSMEVGSGTQKPIDSLHVFVDGRTVEGDAVFDELDVRLGTNTELSYSPGTYTFTFAAFTSADGKLAYKAGSAVYTFDGKKSQVVRLPLVIDEDKMAEIAAAEEAAKAQAEAEAAAAAQRAAEEKAAADAAAAAQAQSAAKQQQPSSSGGGTVYVASSGQGKRYHMDPTCSRMKGTISMTVSEAKAAGYGPCSKCC